MGTRLRGAEAVAFAEQWEPLPSDTRDRLLGDPWA